MRPPVFYMTAWGLLFLASCLPFKACAVPLSEQRSPYSWEVMRCLLIRAITAGPGTSTGFGPREDNCFSSRWGEQLNNRGKITQSSWEPSREESEWWGCSFGEMLWKNKQWSRVWLTRQLSTEWADERDLIWWIHFPWRNYTEYSKERVWAELESAFQHLMLPVSFTWYFSRRKQLFLPEPYKVCRQLGKVSQPEFLHIFLSFSSVYPYYGTKPPDSGNLGLQCHNHFHSILKLLNMS